MRARTIGCLLCVGFVVVAAWSIGSSTVYAEEAKAQPGGVCPSIGYQTDRCECSEGERCEGCPSNLCAADGNCACMNAVRQSAGTIKGTVRVTRAKVKTEGPKSYKDVVVFLDKVRENTIPNPAKHAVMDQRSLTYIPHVLPIQAGTTVDFHNNDTDKHNVYVLYDDTGETEDFGTWSPGDSRSHQFNDPNAVIALCRLQLEMAAYIVVLENPFFTLASLDGETQEASFVIKNVPPGTYELKIWHKKLKLKGGSQEVVVEKGKTSSVDLAITKAKYAG